MTQAVAKQDYGLEILKDDLSSIVRNCAIKRLEEAKHVFTTDDIADAFIKTLILRQISCTV